MNRNPIGSTLTKKIATSDHIAEQAPWRFWFCGGGVGLHTTIRYKNKTDDLKVICSAIRGWKMGFEPTTLGTTILYSNQLSYIHHIDLFPNRCANIHTFFYSPKFLQNKFFIFLSPQVPRAALPYHLQHLSHKHTKVVTESVAHDAGTEADDKGILILHRDYHHRHKGWRVYKGYRR